MLRVIDVDYISDYKLLVTFSDGNRKIVIWNHILKARFSVNYWIRRNLFNMA